MNKIQDVAVWTKAFIIGSMEQQNVPNLPNTEELRINHKGLFVSLVSSDEIDLCQQGFMEDGLTDIADSIKTVALKIVEELISKSVPIEKIKTSTFYLTVINDCAYMPDPLIWDENSDGVYFMWGERFKGMYLPHQIRRMNMSKIDILDRLCCWECQLPSSLWRLPEGLCWRLVCQVAQS